MGAAADAAVGAGKQNRRRSDPPETGMDVESGAISMRPALTVLTRCCLATALVAPLHALHAQDATASAACVAASGPDSVSHAVSRASTPVARRGSDTSRAALRILASVTADEVRFIGSPRVCVRLTGDVQLDSVRLLGRRNLASPVVSGTTYRNVYVAVEILGHLNAECIASRITGPARGTAPGTAADGGAIARCASLEARGGTGTGTGTGAGTDTYTSTSSSTPPAVPPRR
jgi:hypothetical protein